MRSYLMVLGSWLLLAACQPMSVNTQSDPTVDLSSYRTYDWLPEKESQLSEEKALLIKQFKFAVERELQAKGVSKSSSNPDFLISFYGSSQDRSTQRMVETSDYWGDRGRYAYYSDPRSRDYDRRWNNRVPDSSTRTVETQTIEYKEGTLVVDFLDAKSKELVWQAKVQTVVDEQDTAGMIEKIAAEAISKFPN
ncbi:DUF4136 domain-containing protein [Motiliproteus sp. SC1-56]|uniref:DUF4136 domain-containing protein n=1 Tax=Motiliproteus sp. SC1-56 TaxID=2799565 RepID=UPI001A90A4DD|nr:DUF4136 domain-containing protein [Motiliproteus sp. SC1-56]